MRPYKDLDCITKQISSDQTMPNCSLTWHERVYMPRGEKAEDLALYAVKRYKFQKISTCNFAFSLVNFVGGFRPTESIRFLAMSRCSCVKNRDGLVVEGRSGMMK